MPSSISHLPSSSSEAQTASLLDSFRIQLRVIGALLIRESLTRYGRHNIGFLWLFAEPMLFTLGITALWNLAGMHKGSSLNITEFVLVGYSTMLVWRNMPNRCVMALPPNYDLLFHRQVKPIDVFLARCILEAAGATASFFVLTMVFINIGLVRWPENIFMMIEGWALLIWYGLSISLIVGALSERTEMIDRVWHIIQYFMIPLSGSLFLLEMFPADVRSILLWVPPVNCAELIRSGYFGNAITSYFSVSYVIVFNAFALLLALAQLKIAARDLAPT